MGLCRQGAVHRRLRQRSLPHYLRRYDLCRNGPALCYDRREIFVQMASSALTSVGEDPELLEVGEHCKRLALETVRFGRRFIKAAHQQERAFYKMNPERWRCREFPHPVDGEPNAWEVELIDWAPNHFDWFLDIEPPEWLPTRCIRLTADNSDSAEKEAADIEREFDTEFYKTRKQAGVAFNRDAHYKNWTRSHRKLQIAVARLARLKAATVEGLNIKAMVLAVAHDAFDDPNIWNEPLQKSITRDIKCMGRII